jgi:hypothetical protein
MTGEPFDPYDDTIPVSERLGMQRLYDEPEPRNIEAEEPSPVVNIGKLRRRKRANALKQPLQPPQQTAPKPPSKPRANRRELSSTGLEVIGLTLFSAGFWLIHVWLGLIVAGLCLILLGVATSNQLGGPRD